MDVPEAALTIARRFEGFSAKPYICPAGFWTIGYGHLCTSDHPTISKEEGEAYLQQDMAVAAAQARSLCPALAAESEGRQAAIIDFVFNLGAGRLKVSTLRKKVNEGAWDAVPAELRKWVWGGGRKLPGLVLRRELEASLV